MFFFENQEAVSLSQEAKAVCQIRHDSSDEEIDEDENLYTVSVWSDKPVASDITVNVKIYLPADTKRPDSVTFTIPKGTEWSSDTWKQRDDPTYILKVEITSIFPTEDSTYSYVINNDY